MHGFKHAVLGTAAALMVCAPVANAEAHGFGHVHPWGLGRGLLGAVVGLATLPIAIASAALSATGSEAPYQSSPGYDGPRSYAPPAAYYAAPQSYAPPPAYYAVPQSYYAPRRAYYSRAPVYSPAPRAYYAPGAYYAPRPGYYGGQVSYRPGGYAYPRR
jgi:hypothetical protein